MGLFKKKIIKEIDGGAWGHLVNKHKIDVDTISKDLRCVEREGFLDGGRNGGRNPGDKKTPPKEEKKGK